MSYKYPKPVQRWADWVRYVITHPLGEMNQWQRAARFAYDLGRFGVKQLQEDRASQMAAALTFRTLFSLLPVLVVTTILLKAIKGVDEFKEVAKGLFTTWGLDSIYVTLPDTATAATTEETSLSFFLLQLIDKAGDIQLATVGWVGVALVMYASISLMATIETGFNTIYRAPNSRPWVKRVVVYYFVLTVTPVMLGVMFYLNSRLNEVIQSLHVLGWLVTIGQVVWVFCTVWLLMFLVYWQVPNTQVSWRPALVGGFVAAVPLLAGGKGLGEFVGHAVAVKSLFSSLGMIPLLMYWAYLMWLAVLFGLEVAATLQTLRGRQIEELKPQKIDPGVVDPTSILELMGHAATCFRKGQPVTRRALAEHIGVTEPVVTIMIEKLLSGGLLHRVAGDDNAVTLAKPPDLIMADELLDISFSMTDGPASERRFAIVDRLRQAQKMLASQVTLASLGGAGKCAVDEGPPKEPQPA